MMEQANPTRLKQQKKMFATIFPYENRHCTDVCCIVIGLVFSVAILTFALVSYNNTHINQTSLPSDTTGKVCGIDYPKYSFIYFVNPPDISQRVCVAKCPQPGSDKLSCVASGDIGCSFSQTPGFIVTYYENEQVQDNNGNFCMPTDPQLKASVIANAKLDKRLVFFNSYYTLEVCLGLAVGVSILFALLVQCMPKIMTWFTIYASVLCLIGLAVILFFYKTQNPSKIYISIALAVLFMLILMSACLYSKQIKIGGIFLEQGTGFISSNLSTIFYILLFSALTLGFFWMITKEYEGLISRAAPSFDAGQDIYYQVNSSGLWVVWTVLGIQFLWGLSFLKESFNFCMGNHAVRYYMKKGAGMCSIPETLKLLVFKHLGSVIGGSFINVFFFLPDILIDFFRKDTNNDENESGSCLTFFDLVRNDAMAYVALSGNAYCQSAKYCEYFTHESLLCEGSQSVLRLYRICAHVLIAGMVSIAGLYIKGAIEPYTVGLTVIIGIFSCTYIVSYQADPSEALLMMYSIEQEYNTKRAGETKQQSNLKDEGQRKRYLDWLTNKGKQLSFANQVKDIKEEQWNQKGVKKGGVEVASRVDDRLPIQQIEIPKRESHFKEQIKEEQDEYNEAAQK